MSARKYLIVVLALVAVPLRSQVDSSGAAPAGEEAPMITPSPMSDESYSLAFASETPRTNYLRAGLNVGSVYDDNVLNLASSERGISDVRYSVWPALSLEQSRSRLRWDLTYSPGFTYHQRFSSLHGVDHSLALGLEYRLSPYVTLRLRESFEKTSDLLNLFQQSAAASGDGAMHSPSDAIVPPATARISNSSNVEITYQFGQNSMVGAKGSLSGLWYPNRASLTGLFDSTAGAGEGFYTYRLSGRHYIGVTYAFQRLFTHPGQGETETQSTLLFYTLYLPPTLALSVFAGPEHSDTHGGTSLPLSKWSPAAGASLGWHGARAGFAVSYTQRISSGGGLSGAVRSNSAGASVRWQLARTVTTGMEASYSTNSLLDPLPSFHAGGHTWSGTASLQHPLGERLAAQIGYTRLHQSYSNIAAISNAPDRNNVWISLSYQFERPLGR